MTCHIPSEPHLVDDYSKVMNRERRPGVKARKKAPAAASEAVSSAAADPGPTVVEMGPEKFRESNGPSNVCVSFQQLSSWEFGKEWWARGALGKSSWTARLQCAISPSGDYSV
eukprot:720188-Pyramimonas_sp.AAC.1